MHSAERPANGSHIHDRRVLLLTSLKSEEPENALAVLAKPAGLAPFQEEMTPGYPAPVVALSRSSSSLFMSGPKA